MRHSAATSCANVFIFTHKCTLYLNNLERSRVEVFSLFLDSFSDSAVDDLPHWTQARDCVPQLCTHTFTVTGFHFLLYKCVQLVFAN